MSIANLDDSKLHSPNGDLDPGAFIGSSSKPIIDHNKKDVLSIPAFQSTLISTSINITPLTPGRVIGLFSSITYHTIEIPSPKLKHQVVHHSDVCLLGPVFNISHLGSIPEAKVILNDELTGNELAFAYAKGIALTIKKHKRGEFIADVLDGYKNFYSTTARNIIREEQRFSVDPASFDAMPSVRLGITNGQNKNVVRGTASYLSMVRTCLALADLQYCTLAEYRVFLLRQGRTFMRTILPADQLDVIDEDGIYYNILYRQPKYYHNGFEPFECVRLLIYDSAFRMMSAQQSYTVFSPAATPVERFEDIKSKFRTSEKEFREMLLNSTAEIAATFASIYVSSVAGGSCSRFSIEKGTGKRCDWVSYGVTCAIIPYVYFHDNGRAIVDAMLKAINLTQLDVDRTLADVIAGPGALVPSQFSLIAPRHFSCMCEIFRMSRFSLYIIVNRLFNTYPPYGPRLAPGAGVVPDIGEFNRIDNVLIDAAIAPFCDLIFDQPDSILNTYPLLPNGGTLIPGNSVTLLLKSSSLFKVSLMTIYQRTFQIARSTNCVPMSQNYPHLVSVIEPQTLHVNGALSLVLYGIGEAEYKHENSYYPLEFIPAPAHYPISEIYNNLLHYKAVDHLFRDMGVIRGFNVNRFKEKKEHINNLLRVRFTTEYVVKDVEIDKYINLYRILLDNREFQNSILINPLVFPNDDIAVQRNAFQLGARFQFNYAITLSYHYQRYASWSLVNNNITIPRHNLGPINVDITANALAVVKAENTTDSVVTVFTAIRLGVRPPTANILPSVVHGKALWTPKYLKDEDRNGPLKEQNESELTTKEVQTTRLGAKEIKPKELDFYFSHHNNVDLPVTCVTISSPVSVIAPIYTGNNVSIIISRGTVLSPHIDTTIRRFCISSNYIIYRSITDVASEVVEHFVDH